MAFTLREIFMGLSFCGSSGVFPFGSTRHQVGAGVLPPAEIERRQLIELAVYQLIQKRLSADRFPTGRLRLQGEITLPPVNSS